MGVEKTLFENAFKSFQLSTRRIVSKIIVDEQCAFWFDFGSRYHLPIRLPALPMHTRTQFIVRQIIHLILVFDFLAKSREHQMTKNKSLQIYKCVTFHLPLRRRIFIKLCPKIVASFIWRWKCHFASVEGRLKLMPKHFHSFTNYFIST